MKNCIFCKIIRGELPVSKVYEDQLVLAFMDLGQINRGHVLITPKKHAAEVAEVGDETFAHMAIIAKKINIGLRKSDIKTEGINFLLSDGKAAGQEVFHTHLHVVPRFVKDGFGFKFPPKPHRPTRDELDETAEIIRLSL